MRVLDVIGRRYFRALFNCRSRSIGGHMSLLLHSSISSSSFETSFLCSISRRRFSVTEQYAKNSEENQSVGLPEKIERSDVAIERATGNGSIEEGLRKLEDGLTSLNETSCEGEMGKKLQKKGRFVGGNRTMKCLSALFADKKKILKLAEPTDYGNEDPMAIKELSPVMQSLAHHLYIEGYFKDATFMPKNRFDLTVFEVSYSREYLKFAAVEFGKDHQCIAKWLSTTDLKKIALLGCPSLGQNSIYSAKHMRKFLGIKEHLVCQKCTMKHSCKLANVRPWKDSTQLHLASVIRVLAMYDLESVPKRLVVPEEVKDSVCRLLREIIKLSRIV